MIAIFGTQMLSSAGRVGVDAAQNLTPRETEKPVVKENAKFKPVLKRNDRQLVKWTKRNTK